MYWQDRWKPTMNCMSGRGEETLSPRRNKKKKEVITGHLTVDGSVIVRPSTACRAVGSAATPIRKRWDTNTEGPSSRFTTRIVCLDEGKTSV